MAPLAGKVRYGSGKPNGLTSSAAVVRMHQARHMADLISRSQRGGKIAAEQTDTLLKQPIAVFGIT